jgi:hypothetical protein
VTTADFAWQRHYIETFVAAVKDADWTKEDRPVKQVAAEMRRFLANEDLAFLMELSMEPVAAKLGW